MNKEVLKAIKTGTFICCHVCGDRAIDIVPSYEFRGVTSDCMPWHRGFQLCVCRSCGCVQKVTDDVWKSDVDKIYQGYSIYHQGDGAEQAVFDGATGKPSARSEYLLQHLCNAVKLPKKGRLLDVGCGNGVLLSAFNHLLPSWTLAGTELNDKYQKVVEGINGVEAFYTCSPGQVPNTYTLITMIHVLEHILNPREFIASLQEKLEDGGFLVVQIPNYIQNPFDLLIVDHCTHFSVETVTELVNRAGCQIVSVATDWVPKELTIVMNKAKDTSMNRTNSTILFSLESVKQCLQWLQSVLIIARQVSAKGNFGLFGTSIAATWLFSELWNAVGFFVDEDPNRTGKTHMGLPILHPRDVLGGSHVFIALPTMSAQNIQARMVDLGYKFNCYLPPPLSVK